MIQIASVGNDQLRKVTEKAKPLKGGDAKPRV
jgi:hypothetical protein